VLVAWGDAPCCTVLARGLHPGHVSYSAITRPAYAVRPHRPWHVATDGDDRGSVVADWER